MRIIINAISVKKLSGGVFQIATNFILNTVDRNFNNIKWFYVVSEDLHQVFKHYEFSKLNNYFVFPTQPDFRGSYFKVRKELKSLELTVIPDVIYTIASPSYFSFKAPEVMRFANAWVTNPNKFAHRTLSLKRRIRNKIYIENQKRLMRKRQFFITQTETVKKGILSIVKTNPDNVKVVANVLPDFYSKHVEKKNDNKLGDDNIFIACVAAPTPHKNLEIIPSVLRILRERYNITNAIFITTIPESSEQYNKLKRQLEENNLTDKVENYGYCTQSQLSKLYNKCEICFLPTLLETFSATLIEAMFFSLATVTTDFPFNKEVIGGAALYYKPMDAEDAANKLNQLVISKSLRDDLKGKIPKYLEKYSTFENYMNETISFLEEVTKMKS